jgi:hypothetical protein
MTVKQKQALTRVFFIIIIILLVGLRLAKLHKDYSPLVPYTVMISEALLGVFIIFLFIHAVRFINEAREIFRKKNNG